MPFFFRRSANLGPFRINFSKSGVGASVGVKGARLTRSARGTTYVTVGGNGFYYRETLSKPREAWDQRSQSPPQPPGHIDDIPNADIAELVDSSSERLIQRLNERAAMFNPAWIIWVLAIVALVSPVFMASAVPEQHWPTLPTAGRIDNADDDYSMLVGRYGFPDTVKGTTRDLADLSVRSVLYAPAGLNIKLVLNGCVGEFSDRQSALEAKKRGITPRRVKKTPAKSCALPTNAGWTIVGYSKADDDQSITPVQATSLLDQLTIRRTAKPDSELADSSPISFPEIGEIKEKPKAPVTWVLPLLMSAGLMIMAVIVQNGNSKKRLTRLVYRLNETQQQRFAVVEQALDHLGSSHRLWRIDAKSYVGDWKRNAGASQLLQRSHASANASSPPRLEVNLSLRSIDVGDMKLFFLPDSILCLSNGRFGAISYDDFRVEQSFTTFIEGDGVPADAKVTGQTWRYVNKDGGPDRRFNNNVRIPVVQYGLLILSSSHGLNVHLHTSNCEKSVAFRQCWHEQASRKSSSRKHSESDARSAPPPPPPPPPPPSRNPPDSERARALQLFGLDNGASQVEITAAFHRRAQMYHPDRVVGLGPEIQAVANAKIRELNAAYEKLRSRG